MRLAIVSGLLVCAASVHGAEVVAEVVEEIVVSADGSVLDRARGAAAVSAIDRDTLELARHNHIYETMVRVPGVWISRGSGQEHLTAIRSPVYTGAGACGEFLFMENGVPIRPEGFCNVNNLFELNTEQAAAIEVARGPNGALFGGNAVHGVINVVSPVAPQPWRISIEGGPYDYGQIRLSGSQETRAGLWLLDGNGTHTNGYRDATGYDQQKLTTSLISEVADWRVRTTLSGTNLNQETGGFVGGFEAYKDSDLRKSNPNPEAYRDAWAVRLTSAWARLTEHGALELTPYLRYSDMNFLQHFLPGQPREKNDQTSAGLITTLASTSGAADQLDWRVGSQLEWADGALNEYQRGPTEGSAFLVETRPQGLHYDYDVRSLMAAGFYHLRWQFRPRLALVHGLRVEWLQYDYENHGLVGNTRDDGTVCGFGGCLYTRPDDRDDSFSNVAGRLGLEWRPSDTRTFYAEVSSGFRPPQATELYRLQNGQQVADLDSERIWSGELGARLLGDRSSVDLALFAERSDNVILRDANGFNISDGETESFGVELEANWSVSERNQLELSATYARHEYAFDRLAALGERIEDGNDVDTAPRWFGSARWRFDFKPGLLSEVEAVYMDEYYLNAANTAQYDGHSIVNWRGTWRFWPRAELFARVLNVFDKDYADRADFAFGGYRYFPAMRRQFYLGLEYTF